MSRVRRNKFIDRWSAREWEIRRRQAEMLAKVRAAYAAGDADEAPLFFGQDAGMIDSIVPAGDIVRSIAKEAETVLTGRLPAMVK